MPGPRVQTDQPLASTDLSKALDQVPVLFSASQHSVATHRKNINTLHGVFLRCVEVTTTSKDGKSLRLTGEKAFGDTFRNAVVHPLGVKKGVEQADRVIKFVAGFIGFAVEYDTKKQTPQAENEEDEDDDGPASRLVSNILAFLLKGFQSKNKIARFRCVQLVALMVNSLGEIDDDTYRHLKTALLERVRDKEATVRMQAVVALAKLQDADEAEPDSDIEDEDDADDATAQKVTEVLIDVLMHDPAAEVRRAALFNLIPSPITLPSLIQRTLDIDAINRRAAFSHVLQDIPCATLSQEQREQVLARGLRDREEGVNKAARRLAVKWTEESRGLVNFLTMFNIYHSKAAGLVLQAIFETKPDLMSDISFGDAFYHNLTPQTSFIARNFFDHLRTREDPSLPDLEPVVTALAFTIQAEWTKLLVQLEGEERDESKELAQEFIVGELVGMAVNIDYGDEIGRRKMFELMRELLSHSVLPSSLIPRCLDVLLKGTSERDFMRIVVEIVQSLRADSSLVTSASEAADSDDEDNESSVGGSNSKTKAKPKRKGSMGPSHMQRRKELDLRCLVVTRTLLERFMGALQENSMLHGLVAELIVPSVKTKDVEVRAEGLICLGLCCLLDKSMALDSFELLARQSQATDGTLQVKILQTLFDIIQLHGIGFGAERGFGSDVIIGFLMNSLEQEEPEVAATAVVGIVKLVLSGMVTDEEILSRLILLYFASETNDNQELRQCLSFFFPVYCYSRSDHQRRIRNVLIPTLALLKGVYDDLGDKSTMVSPQQIGLQLIDWTDPQKVIETPNVEVDESLHFDLAVDIVKVLYQETGKEERKLFCQLLPKLYVPDEIEEIKVKSLLLLTSSLKANRPFAEAVSKNTFLRFENSLMKSFGERIKALSKAEIQSSDEVRSIRDFIKSIFIDVEVEDEEGDSEEEGEGKVVGRESDAEDDDEEDDVDDAKAVERALRVAVTTKLKDHEEEADEDDGEDEDEDM